MSKTGTCSRCKRNGIAVDCHHIVFRSQGGSDDPDNLCDLCEACHTFIHEEAKLVDEIEQYYRSNRQSRRMLADLSEDVLELIREQNTPEKIAKRGIYLNYWKSKIEHEREGRPS